MTAIVVVLMALVVIFLLTRVSWVISRRERRSINNYGETLDVLAKLSSQNSPTPSRTKRGPSSPEQVPESDDVGLESGGTEQPHPRSLIGPLQLGNARRLRPLGRPSHAPPGAATSVDNPFGDAAGASAWARPRPHPPGASDAETPVPVGRAGVPPDRRRDQPAMVFVDDSVVDEPSDEPATGAGAISSGLLPEAPPSTTPSDATESPTTASAPTESPTTASPTTESPTEAPVEPTPEEPRPERPRWPAVETGAQGTVVRLGFGDDRSRPDGDRDARTEAPGQEAAAATSGSAALTDQGAQLRGPHPAGATLPEESGKQDAGGETDGPVVFIDDAEPWGAIDAGERPRSGAAGPRPPRSRPPGPRGPDLGPPDPGAAGPGASTGATRRHSPVHRRRARAGLIAAMVAWCVGLVGTTRVAAARVARSPVWGTLGTRTKEASSAVATGAARVARSPVWGALGAKAKDATSAAATGAARAGRSPVWGALGVKAKDATSAAATGAARVGRSPVWGTLGTRAKAAMSAVAAKAGQLPAWEALRSRFRGATGAAAAVAVVAVAVVVAVVLALTLGGGGPAPSRASGHRPLAASPTTTTTTTGGAGRGSPTTTASPVALVTSNATNATYQVQLQTYTLSLASSPGPCWVEVRASSQTGPVMREGILPAGQQWDVPATGTLWVRVGFEANIKMSVNGTLVQATTPTPAPYDFMFVTG